MENTNKLVREWLDRSNTINVIAFILFYLSRHKNSYLILYVSLAILITNGILTLNYYLRTRKLKESLTDYKEKMNQFYIRFFFIAFFIVFGIMTLVDKIYEL